MLSPVAAFMYFSVVALKRLTEHRAGLSGWTCGHVNSLTPFFLIYPYKYIYIMGFFGAIFLYLFAAAIKVHLNLSCQKCLKQRERCFLVLSVSFDLKSHCFSEIT